MDERKCEIISMGSVDMTIPKKLEEKRDQLAEIYVSSYWPPDCELEEEEMNTRKDIIKDYTSGFDSASAEYEKIIKELEDTLQKIGGRELESWGAMYEDMAKQALSKLKEFRGEK